MGKDQGEEPRIIKVGHAKSSCKLNVPIKLARGIGLDKVDYVLILKTGDGKLEVVMYDWSKAKERAV